MNDRHSRSVSIIGTTLLVLLLLGLWWLGSILEWWNPGLVPPPGDVLSATIALLHDDPDFWGSVRATSFTIAISYVVSAAVGFGAGFVFWRLPMVGRVLEPVIVSLYAVPFIVFYPVTLVVLGITPWSIIVLAVVLSMIPMLLNTWIGLRAIPSVLYRLGTVYNVSLWTFLRKIAVRHAAPQLFAGLRLSLVFAIISVTAMEFLLFPRGLGFQVRYQYQSFDQVKMLAYTVVIFVIAVLATAVVRVVEAALEPPTT